jgi:hypothetical protein
MIRKFLAMPLLCIGMAFFVQCSDNLSDYSADDQVLKAGKGPGGGGGGGGGGETETAGNNLSYPVFTADNFIIAPIGSTAFGVEYTGDYPGLTAEEIAALEASGPWYAQKTDGNTWQADFAVVAPGTGIDVHFIDWGDVLESVKPTVGRPTRIEVTLYADAVKGLGENEYMTAYTMAVLENPSSPNEQQGTNITTYESLYATVVSGLPKLVIQYVGGTDISTLTWDGDSWQSDGIDLPIIDVAFGPELNVGGKYIYGASSGGWKPTQTGVYRLTFYLPGSDINVGLALIGNSSNGFTGDLEGGASTPVVDAVNNLTYDDVTVVNKGGGGGSGRR